MFHGGCKGAAAGGACWLFLASPPEICEELYYKYGHIALDISREEFSWLLVVLRSGTFWENVSGRNWTLHMKRWHMSQVAPLLQVHFGKESIHGLRNWHPS